MREVITGAVLAIGEIFPFHDFMHSLQISLGRWERILVMMFRTNIRLRYNQILAHIQPLFRCLRTLLHFLVCIYRLVWTNYFPKPP